MLNGSTKRDGRFYARDLDGHLVVIDMAGQELRVLNPTASVLWLSLSLHPHALNELTALLAGQVGGDTATIAGDIADCLADWRACGWLADHPDGRVGLAEDGFGPAGTGVVTPAGPDEDLPDAVTEAHPVRLLNGAAVVHLGAVPNPLDPDLVPRLRGVLSGFAASPDADEGSAELRFIVGPDRIWLETPAGLAWTTDATDALSHLVYCLFLAADPGRRPLATIHAAAVGRRGRGLLLLPGLSGCGKSTLAAWLVARGWSYGGDDIIALSDMPEPTVLPFTTAVSVKPGSWDLLSRIHPVIATLPETAYAGKRARFLPLPPASHVGREASDRMPRAIVFPRFDATAAGRLEPVGGLDALLELVACGFTTGDRLDAGRLARLFDLLETLPKYRLAFPDCGAAESALAPLLD